MRNFLEWLITENLTIHPVEQQFVDYANKLSSQYNVPIVWTREYGHLHLTLDKKRKLHAFGHSARNELEEIMANWNL